MAMAKCRECGTEVSDQAKACPKCGVSKPVKKTSALTLIVTGLFCFVALRMCMSAVNNNPSAPSGSSEASSPPAPPLDPREEAQNSLSLEKFSWYKGGFDSVMMINATIKNDGKHDVKDITIECIHASNSGTRIDSNKNTVFEMVKAGSSKRIKDFSMGFIHSQAASTNCSITDFVLL
jgi:RNA polymerase subunit RPABC4/transcription elongation factor Spt4